MNSLLSDSAAFWRCPGPSPCLWNTSQSFVRSWAWTEKPSTSQPYCCCCCWYLSFVSQLCRYLDRSQTPLFELTTLQSQTGFYHPIYDEMFVLFPQTFFFLRPTLWGWANSKQWQTCLRAANTCPFVRPSMRNADHVQCSSRGLRWTQGWPLPAWVIEEHERALPVPSAPCQ